MNKILICLLVTIVSTKAVSAQSTADKMKIRVETLETTIGGVLGKDGVKQTQQAMMGDGQISTLNGATQFSSQVSCGSDAHYLNVGGTFTATGLHVNITSDTDLNGTMDSTYSVNNISGVCANGYFKCAQPSTATACEYYEWVGHPLGDIHRNTASEIQNLYNCRCIDASCDPNSASNLLRHLEDVGSGIVQNYQKQNPYFAVSGIKNIGTSLQFHGQVSTACSSTPPDSNLTSYFRNPQTQAPAAASQQATNHYFQVASSSKAQADTSVNTTCSIIRNVSLNEIQQNDVIEFVGQSNSSVSSCGSGCLNVQIGSGGNDNLTATDGCTLFDAFAEFEVKRPDLITNVSLLNYNYDDLYHIDVNGSTVVSTNGFLKTNPEPASCDYSQNHHYSGPPLNITSLFQTAGTKRITSTVAVGGDGEHLSRFRIRFKNSEDKLISVYGVSQGYELLKCDFDLKTGVMACTSDGKKTLHHMTGKISYKDACESGKSTISVISSGTFDPDSIWPGQIYGTRDETISVSQVHPSCANNLKGSFKVTDPSGRYDWFLSHHLSYKIMIKECTVNQSIIDNCSTLPLNECTLKDHSYDGIAVVSNYSPTGFQPAPQTQTIIDGGCSVSVTEDFFIQNKTFACPAAPSSYMVDTSHLQSPTFSGGDMTITTKNPDPSNPTSARKITMPIPELPKDNPCALECRVKKTTQRNEVNTGGTETNRRNASETTEIYTKPCSQSVCPVDSGETIIEPCSCLNQFAQVAASLEVLRLAGKDISCVVP
ncbi:hypothetical protein [Thalassotalea marina]|uniref:Uncharacterized protein n=1 Tax=Thalassotalea marina TaxID=1673741 RepID=A0A919BSI0_9GAMM|nr:hypothetical protein [Thalassotalea marina]GHG07092.1 hypothetical protein GCM10017161_40920 [Thalassotalea marina]